MQKIHEICKKEKIEKIIVGLPRNMDGSEGESAKNCKDFASTLSDITNLPVTMVDERCTTITAHNFLNENNGRRILISIVHNNLCLIFIFIYLIIILTFIISEVRFFANRSGVKCGILLWRE